MATKIRLELQVLDGQTIRCAVVELTNGAGGVYAKTVKACSRAVTTPGVSFGGPFLKPDGTYTGNDIVLLNRQTREQPLTHGTRVWYNTNHLYDEWFVVSMGW